MIAYRFVGPMTEESYRDAIFPKIEKALQFNLRSSTFWGAFPAKNPTTPKTAAPSLVM